MSIVERARIVRVPSEAQLERALINLLESPTVPGRLGRGGPGTGRGRTGRLRIARRRSRPDQPTIPGGTPPAPVATPTPVPQPERDDEGAAAAVPAP